MLTKEREEEIRRSHENMPCNFGLSSYIPDLLQEIEETENWRISIAHRPGDSYRTEDAKHMYGAPKHFPDEVIELLKYDNEDDMDFIAASRTLLPECARRLARAIEAMKSAAFFIPNDRFKENLNLLADELEVRISEAKE